MKELQRILKERKTICFLDLEGTQTSHEIIEIGAYKATIRPNGTIKKIFPPYRAYVKAKHPIGFYVTKLTGITEAKIRNEGIPFRTMLHELVQYVGKDFESVLFLVYGNQDASMFIASSDNNLDADEELACNISHKVFDFGAFFSNFVRSEADNMLSLEKACEVYGISFQGKAHDALTDAYNLMLLYQAMLEKKDITKREYASVLSRTRKVPSPLRALLRELQEKGSVTKEDFDRLLEDDLR